MRFSTAKVTRSLLTLTDKLTWYRQRDVLIFPQLGSSGDAPDPRHLVVRVRSLSKGRLRDFRRVRAWGPFLYEGQFLLSRRRRFPGFARTSRPFPSEARD
jgi:hypothetical protein